MKTLLKNRALTVFIVLQYAGLAPVVASNLADKPAHQAEWIVLQQQLFADSESVDSKSAGPKSVEAAAIVAMTLPAQLRIWAEPVARGQLQSWASRRASALQVEGALQCENAPELSRAQFANGWQAISSSNAPRWFKLSVPDAAQWTLQGYAADDDPALSAFINCNTPAIASADDDVFLQPALTLPKSANAKIWLRLDRAYGAATLLTPLVTGRITGTVSPEGPANNILAGVRAYTATGSYVSESTLANGTYSLDLLPGDYYLVARSGELIPQLYNNIECPLIDISQCDLTSATRLSLAANQTLSQINFSLTAGGKITGRLKDEQTGLGVAGVVQIRGVGANPYTNTLSVGDAGRLEIPKLPAGQYLLTAAYGQYSQAPGQQYLAQRFDGHNCTGISPDSCSVPGDAVVVVRDQTRANIDFRLRRVNSISGTLFFASGNPETVQIELLDDNGNTVAGTNSATTYSLSNIPNGSYRMRFSTQSLRMLYPDLICAQPSCADQFGQATVLSVASADTNLIGIDAHIPNNRTLTGHVRDRMTGQGVLAQVQLRQGVVTINTYTNATGEFSFHNPPAGAAVLWASSTTHLDAFYPNLDCQTPQQFSCNVSNDTPTNLNIALLGNTVADFVLNRSSSISGRLLRLSGKSHSFNSYARIRNLFGVQINTNGIFPGPQGYYAAGDLAPGQYLVDWPEDSQFFAAPAQKFTLGLSEALVGPNIQLQPKRAIEGRVTDGSGAGIVGVIIDAWENSRYQESAQTDSEGWYWLNNYVALGANIVLSTDASGQTNQIYNGIVCPLGSAYSGRCDLSLGTNIQSPAAVAGDHLIHFQLEPRGPADLILYDGFETP